MTAAVRGLREWGSKAASWCGKAVLGSPVVLDVKGHPDCNPFTNLASNPDETLLQITQIGESILRGLPAPAPLPARPLPGAARPDTPPLPQIAAHLPAEAPGPAERQAAQGSPQEIIREQLETLTQRVAYVSTLQVLNKVLYKEDSIPISELMRMAGNAPALTTPWTFFSQRAWQAGWTSWLRCAFYYHLIHSTSLIPNAVNTYLTSIVDQIQHHLTTSQNKAKHIDELVERFLEHTAGLLRDYQSGTIKFANTDGPTEKIDDFRDAKIQERYHNDLEGLCSKFSHKLADCLPPVPFFRDWRDTPYLGKLFSPIFNWVEGRLNRYLQKRLRETIFPSMFKSAVLEGRKVEQKKDSRLLVKKALADFFSGQLRNVQERLYRPPQNQPEPKSTLPPQQLASVVRMIKTVLDLEPYTEQRHLKLKLQEQESAIRKRSAKETEDFNDQVQQAIEGAIHAVCQSIVRHTQDPGNTNQMLAQLLTLCNAPFRQGNVPNTVDEWRDLENRVDNASKDLERLALDVFRKIVRDNVNDIVLGVSREKENLTEKAFREQKIAAEAIFYPELNAMLADMRVKVDRQEDILPEIAALAKALRTFGDHERKLQDLLDRIDLSYKDSLQRTLTPLFEGARTLMTLLAQLKKGQIEHTAQAEVVRNLEAMAPFLNPDLAHCTLQDARISLANLTAAYERLAAQFPPNQKEVGDLSQLILLLRNRTKDVLEQREILAQIELLQPQVAPLQHHVSSPNLLAGVNVARQRNSMHLPLEAIFHWDGPAQKLFAPQEKERLKEAILALSQERANVPAAAQRLTGVINEIRRHHTELHAAAMAEFQQQQARTTAFINESLALSTRVRNTKYAIFQANIAQTQGLCAELIEKVRTLQREEILHTTPAAAGAAGMGAAGLLVSATANLLGSPAAALQAAGAFTGMGLQLPSFIHWWKLGESAFVPTLKVSAVALTGIVLAGYAAPESSSTTSVMLGAALPALSGFWGGRRITQSSAKKAEDKVLPEVMGAFQRAIKLANSPIIYHGAMARIMQGMQ